jgi:predicted dehydrogenase
MAMLQIGPGGIGKKWAAIAREHLVAIVDPDPAARAWAAPDIEYAHPPSTLVLMDLAGGVPVVYEGDWATRGPETSWNADWELIGTRGRLTWIGDPGDHLRGEVTLEPWGEAARPLAVPALANVDQAATLAAFLDATATRQQPETSAADNIRSLAIVLACVSSIESSTPQAMDLSDAP